MKLPEADTVEYYHQVSEGRARIAIELVEFDPKFTRVMQFYFGNTFITEDSKVAKMISGGKGGKRAMNCVTLDGDSYGTNGTLQGGSIDN